MPDRTVAVTLRARVGEFVTGMGQAVKSTQGLSEELTKLGKDSPQRLNDIAQAAGGMGLALAAGFGFVVNAAMDFDKQMSEVGAVSGATAAQLEQLRQAALDAGAATQFSATEAAQAQAELAKAGLSTSDILGGALTGSMALAAAGTLDLAEAADISAKTMNVFQLEGKDVGHIADLLAAAANKSATDVHEMGEALRMGGLAANAAGISLEETVATLAAFADRALVGSDAGTSLKTTLTMLQAPSEKSANLMRELGINAFDAQGNFIGIAKLAGVLQKQLSGLTQEQRTAALAQIFGADAMRAANVLYEVGEQGIRDYTNAVDDQGAAAEVAAKKTDNLAGDVERLKGSIETLAIESGSGANSGLRVLVQGAERVVEVFAAIPAPVQTAMTVLAGLGGAALLATAGLVKAKQSWTEALDALSGMGPNGEKAAKGIDKAAAATAKFAAVAAGAIVAAQAIGIAWKAFVDQPKATQLDDLSKGLIEFGKTGKAGAGTIDLFGSKLERLERDLAALNNNMPDNFAHRWSEFVEGISGTGDIDGTFTKAKANIKELDAALAQLVTSGHQEEAAAAFEKIRESAAKSGVNLNELKAGFAQYEAALSGATVTEQKAIAVTEENAGAMDLLTGSVGDAVNVLGDFATMFDRINGKALSLSEATINAEQAIDDFAEQLGKGKVALNAAKDGFDLTSQAGRDLQSALNSVALEAAEAAQAVYDQTGDVNAATATFNNYKSQLIATLDRMGYTRAEAERLADALMRIPKNIATNVVVTARYVQVGKTPAGVTGTNLRPARGLYAEADGGVMEFYAGGGMREWHTAQIAPANAMRVWAEPETGGEAYIPLAPSKAGRSTQILAETDARLGHPLADRYVTALLGGANRPAAAGTVNVNVQVAGQIAVTSGSIIEGIRDAVRVQGGNVQTALGWGANR